MDRFRTIVFAADNNYREQLAVAAFSALENLKNPRKYRFVLLISEDFDKKTIEHIENKCSEKKMKKPLVINMGKAYSEVEMQLKHITCATFYRLNLPEILNKTKKCLYLDVDIVVNQDLSVLFESKIIKNNYIAGVKAAGYYYPEEKCKEHAKNLEIPAIDQYINAGVLLMNLKKMRRDGMKEIFEELSKKGYKNQDQDILNKACYGKIGILEPKFNLMTKYFTDDKNSYENNPALKEAYKKEEWEEALKNPVIIHYADRIKPWNEKESAYAQNWWKYAFRFREFCRAKFFNEKYL